MAYTRKSSSSKKAPVRKAMYSKKPAVSRTVAKLSKQVAKLTKVSYDNVPIVMPSYNNVNLGGLGTTPNVFPLTNFLASAVPLWGYDNIDIQECTKGYLNSMRIQLDVTQHNEPDLIRMSFFLVSLKDQGADSTTFDPATGGLMLASGVHYMATSISQDSVVLNPRFFNVHGTWRTHTGGVVGGQTVQPALRRKIWTLRPKRLIQNPKGNMFRNASHSFPKDPSNNYFVLAFTDNLTGEGESPQLSLANLTNWAIPS